MWSRVDDQFAEHPKVLSLGRDRLAGMGLWLVGLTYANRFLTDGFIPAAAIPAGSSKLATRLVAAGLWAVEADGYRIHDFADYQPSRDEVTAVRAARAEAGRKGGLRSGSTRRSKSEATASATAQAPATHPLEARANPGPYPARTRSEVEIGKEVPTAAIPTIQSNPFIVYRDLTGVTLAGRAEAWLNDYIGRHGPEPVVAALRSAWAANASADGLLERLRPILNGGHANLKGSPVIDLDSLENRRLRGEAS